MDKLKYIGKGFLVGVPARDLDEKDLEDLEVKFPNQHIYHVLIRTGLYIPIETSPAIPVTKARLGGRENKVQSVGGGE